MDDHKQFIELSYEYYRMSLVQSYNYKIFNKQTFPENELFYILKSLLTIAHQLQKEGYLMDIDFDHILLDKSGRIKYFLNLSSPSQITNIDKAKQNMKHVLISPELQLQIQKNTNLQESFSQQSVIFQIAVLILIIATKSDFKDVYDIHANQIQFGKIRQMIKLCVVQYSQFFNFMV